MNLNNTPQLSIITINRNDAQGLEKTLESIWKKQSFKDFEHIIIDGASTDNSINIIKKYASHLSYWVSEPDKGIYNAMNKGIIKAKGNYLLFLNSGDWLENDILARVFKENFTEDIVYADLYQYHNADDIQISPYPDKLTLPFIYNYSLGHPSTFIKRELFKNMLYEEKYRIISDWAFFIKQILLFNRTTKHLNFAVSYFNVYGISSDPKSGNLIMQERSDFFKNNFPYLISEFYQNHTTLQEKVRTQEQALDILSKTKTIEMNLNNTPQLSIITINRNDAQGLEKTLESIWKKQSFKDFEHIIIDGASTDNSINIIKKYASHLSYWVSEPDKGIYNAMNKGIIKAKGNYLLFLNSGDWLENDILARVFKENFTEDIVYADLYQYHNADDIQISPYPDKLTLPFIYNYSLGHPSTFIKRELFKNMLYEEKYRIISDWAFFIKQILLFNRTTKHLNFAVSYFNVYGISSDPKSGNLIMQERSDFFKNEFPYLISEFYQNHTTLQEKVKTQEQALDILSKHRVQQLIDTVWIQRKARQYIKFLFLIERFLKRKR